MAAELAQQVKEAITSLQSFSVNHEKTLPAGAKAELTRFLDGPLAQAASNGNFRDMQFGLAGAAALAAFASGFSHIVAGQQERLRLASLRASEHLQRLLAVDDTLSAPKMFGAGCFGGLIVC